jgi:hypothetical protein
MNDDTVILSGRPNRTLESPCTGLSVQREGAVEMDGESTAGDGLWKRDVSLDDRIASWWAHCARSRVLDRVGVVGKEGV